MAQPGITKPALSLVVPCYNEEECLAATARELLAAFAARGATVQLVLVDNGSHDRTSQVIDQLTAEGHPITKVSVQVNIGYGNGILQGLKHCTQPLMGSVVADGQVSAQEVVGTYEILCTASGFALAKVRRRFRKDSWRRKLVSVLYNMGMQVVFGWMGSIDINGSPKFFTRELYEAMRLTSTDWFLDPEIMIKAKYLRAKVMERDVEGLDRQGGKSHVRYATMFEFAENILRYRFGGVIREWKAEMQAAAASSAAAPGTPEHRDAQP